MKKLSAVFIATAIAISITPVAQAAESANPYGTSTIDPAGPNEVVFTISKGSKKVLFTTSKLNKVKSSVISIYEPFIKKRQSFTVIPIKTFFSLVGISGNDKVSTTALNDYIYTNTAAQFISAGTYIAIKRNGLDIPYDQGGPIRLIFADKSKWAKNLDAWNWSLESILVK
ncbi:hypothetical protein MCEJIRE27_01449 [Candidatus Nanopelagicaceae bacterium]